MTSSTGPYMRWRRPLLTVHIVTAVGTVGAALALMALGIAGLRGADPRTVYPAAHLLEAWVIAPLAVVALGTGLLQATLSQWGVRYWWVSIKLTITTGLTAVVFLVLEPGLAAMADAATGLSAEPLTDAERLRVDLSPAVAVVLLVVNVVLGVYKPGRRLRSGRRSIRRTSVKRPPRAAATTD
jgi:hypothetical protein